MVVYKKSVVRQNFTFQAQNPPKALGEYTDTPEYTQK